MDISPALAALNALVSAPLSPATIQSGTATPETSLFQTVFQSLPVPEVTDGESQPQEKPKQKNPGVAVNTNAIAQAVVPEFTPKVTIAVSLPLQTPEAKPTGDETVPAKSDQPVVGQPVEDSGVKVQNPVARSLPIGAGILKPHSDDSAPQKSTLPVKDPGVTVQKAVARSLPIVSTTAEPVPDDGVALKKGQTSPPLLAENPKQDVQPAAIDEKVQPTVSQPTEDPQVDFQPVGRPKAAEDPDVDFPKVDATQAPPARSLSEPSPTKSNFARPVKRQITTVQPSEDGATEAKNVANVPKPVVQPARVSSSAFAKFVAPPVQAPVSTNAPTSDERENTPESTNNPSAELAEPPPATAPQPLASKQTVQAVVDTPPVSKPPRAITKTERPQTPATNTSVVANKAKPTVESPVPVAAPAAKSTAIPANVTTNKIVDRSPDADDTPAPPVIESEVRSPQPPSFTATAAKQPEPAPIRQAKQDADAPNPVISAPAPEPVQAEANVVQPSSNVAPANQDSPDTSDSTPTPVSTGRSADLERKPQSLPERRNTSGNLTRALFAAVDEATPTPLVTRDARNDSGQDPKTPDAPQNIGESYPVTPAKPAFVPRNESLAFSLRLFEPASVPRQATHTTETTAPARTLGSNEPRVQLKPAAPPPSPSADRDARPEPPKEVSRPPIALSYAEPNVSPRPEVHASEPAFDAPEAPHATVAQAIHETQTLAPDAPKSPVATEILLHVNAKDQPPAAVRVVERGGTVNVSVHAADEGARSTLRSNLGDLTSQLNGQGFKTEVVKTAVTSAPHFETTQDAPRDGQSFSGQHQSQTQDDRQSQRERNPNSSRWLDEFEEQASGQDANPGGKN